MKYKLKILKKRIASTFYIRRKLVHKGFYIKFKGKKEKMLTSFIKSIIQEEQG